MSCSEELSIQRKKAIEFTKRAIEETHNSERNILVSVNIAIDILDSAIIIDSTCYLAHYNKMNYLTTVYLRKESLEFFEIYNGRFPEKKYMFLFQMAVINEMEGDKEKAMTMYNEYYSLIKNNPDNRRNETYYESLLLLNKSKHDVLEELKRNFDKDEIYYKELEQFIKEFNREKYLEDKLNNI